MMKRTQKTVEKMAEILTNNDKAQEVMTMLAEKAEEKGLSLEEWEQVKVGILTNCFFMVAMNDEQIRNDLGMDIYEELNAQDGTNSRNGKGQPPRAVKTGRQPVF